MEGHYAWNERRCYVIAKQYKCLWMQVSYGHESLRPWIQAVEISFLKGVCSENGTYSESNGNKYGRFGMSSKIGRMNCRVEVAHKDDLLI